MFLLVDSAFPDPSFVFGTKREEEIIGEEEREWERKRGNENDEKVFE